MGRIKNGVLVLRKTFSSSDIVSAFENKMLNMELIMAEADSINSIFADKCENKISPEEGIKNENTLSVKFYTDAVFRNREQSLYIGFEIRPICQITTSF